MNPDDNYGSLYRKCRPRVFSEIIGQRHVVGALKRQVSSGNVAHAYLFSGSRGTGKTSTALVFARAINCLNPVHGEPCLTCENCRSANLDIVEMDAASHNSVDDIRELRELVKYAPTKGMKKVYIIDEVHMLSNAAFNALLKTLEEPPAHIVFILATTELHMIPATVQSRCQRFDFRRVSREGMRDKVLEIAAGYGVRIDDEAVELILRIADGSMRDTLALLEQCLSLGQDVLDEQTVADFFGTARSTDLVEMVGDVLRSEPARLIQKLERLYDMGVDVLELLSSLIGVVRDVTVCRISANGKIKGTPEYQAKIRTLTRGAEAAALFNRLVDLSKFMRYSKNKESILEMTLVQFALENGRQSGTEREEVAPDDVDSRAGTPFQNEGAVDSQNETSGVSDGEGCGEIPGTDMVAEDTAADEAGGGDIAELFGDSEAAEKGADIREDAGFEQGLEASPDAAASGSEGNAGEAEALTTKRYVPKTVPAPEVEENHKSAEELDRIWKEIVARVPDEKRQLLKNSSIGLFAGGEMIVHVKGLSKAREMVVEMKVKADVVEAAKTVTGRDCTVKFEAVAKDREQSEQEANEIKRFFEDKGYRIEISE